MSSYALEFDSDQYCSASNGKMGDDKDTMIPSYPRRSSKVTFSFPTEELGIAETRRVEDKIFVKVDVHLFNPNEVSVKVVQNTLIVEGAHEDGRGYVSRTFQKKIQLPPDSDMDNIMSTLGADGYLLVTVPLINTKSRGGGGPQWNGYGGDEGNKLQKVVNAFGSLFHLPHWHQSFSVNQDVGGPRGVGSGGRERFSISLELPGFKPCEIKVKTVGNYLVIEGNKKEEGEGAAVATFRRRYPLPQGVDKEKLQSEFRMGKDGERNLLRVMVPKALTQEE